MASTPPAVVSRVKDMSGLNQFTIWWLYVVFVNLHTESGRRVSQGPHVPDGGGRFGAIQNAVIAGSRCTMADEPRCYGTSERMKVFDLPAQHLCVSADTCFY